MGTNQERAEQTARVYLVTFHESDGNDCTVFDSIIAAESEDAAFNILHDAIEKTLKENKTSFEEDGNIVSFVFNCEDDCGEECQGHGGISLREVEAFDTEAEAEPAPPTYPS